MAQVRVARTQGATFVELFFDLVFVFAITQLTAFVLHDLTWSGVGHAVVLFWLVWWSWTQFTWTLNEADTEHVLVRLPVLAATALAFFLAQSLPDAFADAGLWFAVSYVAVRILGLAMQAWIIPAEDEGQRASSRRWIAMSLVGLVLIVVGGAAGEEARLWWWVGAIVADLVAAGLAGSGAWELQAGHFVERHGLIVIIALGESLIAAGVASSDVTRDVTFAVATAGAVVAACALWWTYFGALHTRLEQAMDDHPSEAIGSFARDVFSFGHALVVAGVIGIAVGFEEAIAHPDVALHTETALAFVVGAVLFIGGLGISCARAGIKGIGVPRAVFVVVALAAFPAASSVPAATTVWALASGAIVLAVVEARGQGAPQDA